MANHPDDLHDFLGERRKAGEFWWAVMRNREDVPEYRFAAGQTAEGIKQQVLQSPRLINCVKEISADTGQNEGELLQEAKAIVNEMGHNFNMGAIRFLALALPKAFKLLFRGIYANKDGVEKTRKVFKESPIVFLPTHRSYIDFLILSYVCYQYDLPMPCIAAGQDFMHMAFVGKLLRNSGAFYMRRSFGSDKLYWAVFTEYVQKLVINGDAPVEFFVEGTRSRTAKSLPPKQGLMGTIVEPYFNGKLTDITFIPVSISYDRVLEEVLYGREMLGVPKPKESTSGLFKARSILSDDFGPFYVHFGEPISLRTHSEGRVDRSLHNLAPRFKFSLTPEEQKFVNEFSYTVILQQQKNFVISAWSLIATLLLQNLGEMSLEDLYRDLTWLGKQTSSTGAFLDWPATKTVQEVVKSCLEVHHSVAMITKDGRLIAKTNLDDVTPRPIPNPAEMSPNDVMSMATVYVIIGHYRNQLTHVFVRMALVAIAIGDQAEHLKDDLFTEYKFLVNLLSLEFIFHPASTEEDFQAALKKLQSNGTIVVSEDRVIRQGSGEKLLSFLQNMFKPFLLGYWVMCQYLTNLQQRPGVSEELKKQSALVRGAQNMMVDMIIAGEIRYFDILSMNLLGNALNALINFTAVRKRARNGDAVCDVVPDKLNKISDEIAGLIEVPKKGIPNRQRAVVIPAEIKAKL
ncbi:dihydroxyacetone phosphate acyltransferase-like [Ptychodera flava]|uniref:dihydroxyacetone phosphate acyltransferase-like n=1 Tax=Ptychodera flava TaxID=63121 RepID=UPI00396A1080